jgi:hypothetical protein
MAAMLLVFILVTLAWVPFRAPTVSTALRYWRGMLDWSNLRRPSIRAALVLIPALGIDWVQYRNADELVFLRWPRLVQATLLALAFLAIFLFAQAHIGEPFIYQGF